MTSLRAARPRLLLASLAAGTLLLGTACNNPAGSGRDQAAATATAAPVAGPTGADNPALAPFYGQAVNWSTCPADPGAAQTEPAATQCGTLHVPLDYTHPGGDALDLALIRRPAARADRRIGSLVVNPGGPGASGVDMVRHATTEFDGALHERFDIVGFDPRGTGASSPVTCLDDKQRDAQDQVDLPLDPQARQALLSQENREHDAACRARSGRLLPFVGTRNTARDLDVLRQVLGDRKLNYLGISYGTYLGALYAEEFPGMTGRLVLDGAVDPAADVLDRQIAQLTGFEAALGRFAADCARDHAADCPLGGDPATAAKIAAEFLDGLQQNPLPTRDGRRLNRGLGWLGTIGFLYGDDQTGWELLRSALGSAMRSKQGDALLAAADVYNGRDSSGHYDPSQDAGTAISCADHAHPAPSAARAQQVYAQLRQQAPLLTKDSAPEDYTTEGCVTWPFRTSERAHTVRAEGSAPILVVGSTGDPATPYAASEALARGFANATLLTREGEGHGAFGKDNDCIASALTAYLVDGTLPAAGTRCAK
ncbi:alpha/beta hydrolase [Kitasatospora sp. NPDC050543]|uniref:alpha/beta hydrolase n=1 Tax=Kitasatospora sp. NPDC050543 TaxID=3364054 RepID=UPI0037AAF91B